LNNLTQQDRPGVKLRIGPMLGFKWFTTPPIMTAASNCSAGSTKASSTLAGYASKIKVCPASGSPY
jgi:hypothetical protein